MSSDIIDSIDDTCQKSPKNNLALNNDADDPMDDGENHSVVDKSDSTSNCITADNDAEKDLNQFSYINQDYTTEIFKIEIRNLPKRVEFSSFISFLRKKKIKYRKVKVMQANQFKNETTSHAYVTLRSAEERNEAIKIIGESKFRGNEISAREATPNADPLIKKRKDNSNTKSSDNSNDGRKTNANKSSDNVDKVNLDENFNDFTEEKRMEIVNTQVASLWNVDYEQQLKIKLDILQKVIKKCSYEFLKICNELPKSNDNRLMVEPTLNWFFSTKLENVVAAKDSYNGYRNKCEFNIGSDKTVGFRLGLYKEGSIKVVNPPANCPIISEQMHQVVSFFQNYLNEKSKLDGFNPVTHEGHWRQILVRTTRSKQCLISIAFHRQTLSEDELEQELAQIKSHFADNQCGVCSIYVQVINDRSSQVARFTPKLIEGESHVYEKLMDNQLEFRISPLSFFQVNTNAAELLYGKICELAKCIADTTVLDICCGTGTIGLCLARSVHKVIGIELNEDAVNDARFNAQHNQIDNVEFHSGRAEVLIGQILSKLDTKNDVVAILDPPRSGLPASLIKSVRNNAKINRLIYVSCEAMAARKNFLDLCRPVSKAYYGRPFVPRQAIPVDLFPHTERCELILLFERV